MNPFLGEHAFVMEPAELIHAAASPDFAAKEVRRPLLLLRCPWPRRCPMSGGLRALSPASTCRLCHLPATCPLCAPLL